jgi:hypothetical protein
MAIGISKVTEVISAKASRVLTSPTGTHSMAGSGRTGPSMRSAIMPGGFEMGRMPTRAKL